MTSPYEVKPKPLFKRLNLSSKNITDQAYCVGFELEVWRCEAYANHLMEWIIDYALKSDELRTLTHANTYIRLREAAARIYKSENYKTRGEVGEISIHAICREFFQTIPIAPRVFYLTSSNEVVKSFDMVHVRYLENDKIELWLGEAKFYTSRSDAIGKAIKSINTHIDQGFLKNEKLLLGPQVSTDIPHHDKIRGLLSEEESLDTLFQNAVFPIFIAANSDAVVANGSQCDEYLAGVQEELSGLEVAINKSGLKNKIKLIIIYVPIESKENLTIEFDKRLKGIQP